MPRCAPIARVHFRPCVWRDYTFVKVLASMEPSKAQRTQPSWLRHFVYRRESWRTTWKLRIGVLVVGIAAVVLTRPFWTVRLAESLVCNEQAPPSDALLLENFDPDYLVFERAEALRSAGIATRVFVPMTTYDGLQFSAVETGTADLMARIARLPGVEGIPIRLIEPISLNAAYQIRDFFTRNNIRSVIVVSPGFRSRRSALVYSSVFGPAKISVGCVPVFGTHKPENWDQSTHGMQAVFEQFLKLQYYRIAILR